MEELLERLVAQCRPETAAGSVADYIPELAKADKNGLGVYIITSQGKHSFAGDCHTPFTIQSVVKPILLLQALMDNGIDAIRSRVGVEATGKAFDAINYSDHRLDKQHLNPMVNMGAILLCTLIHGRSYREKFGRLLALTRLLAQNPNIRTNEAVYASEKLTGNKNRALAYLLKASGMMEDDVEEVLDFYFRACSISVTCEDLAHIGFVLSNRGRLPSGDARIFPAAYSQFVNAVLSTCGMYDGSGSFAVRVGIPAKSGVGGGIMGIVPTRMGIGIYSPGLDAVGNSLAGIHLLELLSRELYLSIY